MISPLIQARTCIIEARGIVRALRDRERDTTPQRLTEAGHYAVAVLNEAIKALDDAEGELSEAQTTS